MKVYFCGSISGGRAKAAVYLDIVEHLEARGCSVLTEHVARPELLAASKRDTAEQTYTQDMHWLEESMAVVAEVTTPSLGVGYEIGCALARGKPVLCLYEEGTDLSRMILGNSHSNLTVRSYADPENLLATLDDFLTLQAAGKPLGGPKSQITFLYYHDLQPAAAFYAEVMGLELVEDQGWAKIFRTGGKAFLGVVAGDKGFCQPQERNAVLVTLVVDDVPGWYQRLKDRGVKMLSDVEHREEIQIRCFFCEDPGGYALEVQQFLNPDLAGIFHI